LNHDSRTDRSFYNYKSTIREKIIKPDWEQERLNRKKLYETRQYKNMNLIFLN
jgi:hypothetical protein